MQKEMNGRFLEESQAFLSKIIRMILRELGIDGRKKFGAIIQLLCRENGLIKQDVPSKRTIH